MRQTLTSIPIPTHYSVIYNSSTQFQKEEFERLTFDQCFQYSGFIGGIKVPAVLKLAKKISEYKRDIEIKVINQAYLEP
eukprot:CAMPEP_0168621688 /NCGR_PEP_ID=MMETSP0449_2-20121227/7839_1 /TAXON_ID=1082188 /ORGANISM="Strombidium rassoulzadegani, Strain ras09" /LENGTH=78 /DNA_ID=CAMNT_0008662847 /DNA_START=180 /DNA_END=416 /DNA_ORIENTATION=+